MFKKIESLSWFHHVIDISKKNNFIFMDNNKDIILIQYKV